MGGAHAAKVVTLHGAGETAATRHPRDIDLLAGHEVLDR